MEGGKREWEEGRWGVEGGCEKKGWWEEWKFERGGKVMFAVTTHNPPLSLKLCYMYTILML